MARFGSNLQKQKKVGGLEGEGAGSKRNTRKMGKPPPLICDICSLF